VARRDRLSALDSWFLALEDSGPAHMHVGACMIFAGPAPSYRQLLEAITARLHLVPRYRQRLAFVPCGQGRPAWADDPHFNVGYHVRHTALPRPGDEEQLKRLAGRVFSQALDRSRPLWEIWLVEGLRDGCFALITKTHHALIDGISGVDVMSVMFDTSPGPVPLAPPDGEWVPRPLPTGAQLLADALIDRAAAPGELLRALRGALRHPRRAAERALGALGGLGALTLAGLAPAPPSPFNVRIGPHRRFAWVHAELRTFKAIRDRLGEAVATRGRSHATVNDVVLTAVAGALGRYLRHHGHLTGELVLKALVPVSVRVDAERGALGNRVAAMWAPLPVGVRDPVARLAQISAAMSEIKESGQAVGAQVLTALSGFAPPTMIAQAMRLQARQRFFNLVVTNVPGPQVPLYLAGHRMLAIYPLVPLAENTALGVAIISYDGRIDFGLVGDYDALADLELLAGKLREEITALARAARIHDHRSDRHMSRLATEPAR